jgi:putative FmdB family regulatory protein
MPIYEYRCEACGHQGEHLQKVSDAPLKVCPECGKAKYRKQLSAAGFQLKGTGWYATDFRGGSKTPEKKSSEQTSSDKKSDDKKSDDKKSGEKKDDKKSESKSSDSKPESKAAA